MPFHFITRIRKIVHKIEKNSEHTALFTVFLRFRLLKLRFHVANEGNSPFKTKVYKSMKSVLLLGIVFLLNSAAVKAVDVNTVLDEGTRNQALRSTLRSNQFQTYMDEISDSVRVKGNQYTFLMNGMMSYPARYALLENAKKSIIVSTFSIYSGQTWDGTIKDDHSRKMVDMLIKKKKQGLEVVLIYDGATSTLAKSQPAINKLRANGISVIKYNPIVTDTHELSLALSIFPGALRMLGNLNPINNRWHEKTMIIDGTYLISGGLNWGTLYATGNNFSTFQYSPESFSSIPLIKEIGVKPMHSWGPLKPDSWRDTDILIKGPIASQAARRLLLDYSLIEVISQKGRDGYKYKNADLADIAEAYQWYTEKYEPHADKYFNLSYGNGERSYMLFDEAGFQRDSTVRYIYQRPYLHQKLDDTHSRIENYANQYGLSYNYDQPSTYITNYYLNVINNAKKQILWGCHSNRPTPLMLEALKQAAQRGVKIYIIGNSREAATTLPEYGQLMYPLGSCNYGPLLTAGKGNIRIFEWQRKVKINDQVITSGAFHSKVFSVDGVLTSVGSYNLSKASFQKHTEGTFVISDKDFAREAEQMFQRDLKFTKEVKLEDIRTEDLSKRCQNY